MALTNQGGERQPTKRHWDPTDGCQLPLGELNDWFACPGFESANWSIPKPVGEIPGRRCRAPRTFGPRWLALLVWLLVSLAIPVAMAAEPKTTYLFGQPEDAKGFAVWVASPRAGLLFTDTEPVDVRVRVRGAAEDTVVEFSVDSAAGDWADSGKLTIKQGQGEQPLPLKLPGRGLFNVTVKAASGTARSQAAAPVAVVFAPLPAEDVGAWGGIYTHPGGPDPNYPNQLQDSVRNMRTLGAGACRLPFWIPSFGKVTVADGKASADFAFWKSVAKALRKEGLFILGNPCQMPKELSSRPDQTGQEGDGGQVWCRSKPKDYRLWDQLMEQMAADFRDEISVWEMWNEPNLFYWTGTPQEYVELVEHTAAAIRRGNPKARISAGSFSDGGAVGKYLSLGLGKHIDILSFHYSDEGRGAGAVQQELEKHKLNLPMWNTEERNEIPLRNLAAGVERSFKFANTVDGYDDFRPVTRSDFTVRPAGIWFSVGAHCIGSGKCIGVSDKLVSGCEVYFFQRGQEKIAAFRNSGAPVKLLDPNAARAKRITLKLEPLTADKPVTVTDAWGRSQRLDIHDGQAEFPLPDGYAFINGARTVEIVKAELPPARPPALVFEAEKGKWSKGWGDNGHAGYSGDRLLEIWTKTEPDAEGYWAELKFSVPTAGRYELIFAGTTLEGLVAGKGWLSPFAWTVDGGTERKVESPLPVIKDVPGAPQGVSVLEVLDLRAGEHTFRLRLLRTNDPPNNTWAMWFDAIAMRPK